MFNSANKFNTPLGSWDVSRVTDMHYSEYIRVWDIVHHCITIVQHNAMYCLSHECMNILTLPHNHFIVYIVVLYHHQHLFRHQQRQLCIRDSRNAQQFNTPLGSWDVSRVTDMRYSEYIRVWDIVRHCITIVRHNAMYCLSDECMNILTLPHNHVIVYIVVLYHHHHHHPQCFILLNNSTLPSDPGMSVG